MTGNAIVDSAAVARAAYARASAALRANDHVTARREAERAAAAWPTQPAYQWARAVIALRAADTTTLLDALTRYAALGLGRDLTADPAMARIAALPRFREVAALHAAQFAPMARSQPRVVMPDTTFYPEGMDVDPRTGFFYVTSVRHRTVAEITPGGNYVRDVLPRAGTGLAAMMAVRVDAKRGVLWATMAGMPRMAGYTDADSTAHALIRVRLPEGEIDGRWDLAPSPAGHTLGDVAIGPLGDVFTTDSRDPVLYRLQPDSGGLQPLRHVLFRSLQGVAPAPDGRTVFVADYSHGLLKVDVLTGDVTRLADAPGSTSLGCDGIAWDDGALVAIQNGVAPPRVMRFVLDSAWTRIVRADVQDRNTAIADEPTNGVVVGDEFIYVANSQWEKYDDAGARLAGTVLRRPVLLSIRLRR
jgi:sugar lactone lactonase YvrE